MSVPDVAHFLHTARAMLNQDRPPVFVRTNWLFVEIDTALEAATALAHKLKLARHSYDQAAARRLNSEIARNVAQIHRLCRWAEEQFQKEPDKQEAYSVEAEKESTERDR